MLMPSDSSKRRALADAATRAGVSRAREGREPTQRVVERASSIFDDYGYAAMRLNFIQEFRNRVVHRGEAGDHALLCAQYGSAYLAALIRFSWPARTLNALPSLFQSLAVLSFKAVSASSPSGLNSAFRKIPLDFNTETWAPVDTSQIRAVPSVDADIKSAPLGLN